LFESSLRDGLCSKFDFQVGDDDAEVCVAATFANAVDRPLDMVGSCSNGSETVGDAATCIVVCVDPDRHRQFFEYDADDFFHLPGQRSSVGVTEREGGSSSAFCGSECLQSV